MKSKYIYLVPIVLIVGWFLVKSPIKSGQESSSQVTKVAAADSDKLINDSSTFMLDVHTPEQTHLPGTDAFIPYDQITQHKDQLPEDKNTPILVYCRSGSMSDTASKELVELGYTNVYDLVGGINEYRESHEEVTLTPESVDLGEVNYHEGAETEFTITNNMPDRIKIEGVSGSCACTQPTIDKTELEPFESTTVKVKFEPSIHQDDSDMGNLARLVFIDIDNENFEHLSFKLTANVVK